jgi:hypothetical protein
MPLSRMGDRFITGCKQTVPVQGAVFVFQAEA